MQKKLLFIISLFIFSNITFLLSAEIIPLKKPVQTKEEKDVVLEAVLNAGEAIQFADPKLKLDKEITLAAIKQSAYAFEHVDDKFKANKEIVETAISSDGYMLEHANKKFKKDKVVVLKALETSNLSNFTDFASEISS